ncbi:SCO1860 family LAETG-anchored protein [Streptomyces sp. NRRL S-87]|uniref:SCO1860 family LAETG-anchored protein n=1 Tax=Streptomyces sp. NRRL S-87 TaxID=1463920 RepID=UPI0004BFC9E7|nr:SCO1860 family LAETG-anchored protein [Streptomyces sp. NRRL S-87]
MNSNTFRTPVRRSSAALAAAALAAGPTALLSAGPAHATGGGGKASAVVLRTGLDVGLLNKTVHVPLKATLNEVQAPASADKTALTVTLDGVEQGKPVSVLRADVASATATADRRRAEGAVKLVNAKIHVPGLPLLSLIQVEKVTARALCEAGRRPVAESNVLGAVTVLGKRVTLSAGGTTKVEVPAVGEVRLDLSSRETTSRTAAATALRLKVSVNPLKLNVAEVDGEVVLAEATCATPAGGPTPSATLPATSVPTPPGHTTKPDVKPQSGGTTGGNLAETGGSSATPYVAGGALLLVGVGAGALVLGRGGRGRDSGA